MVDILTGLKSRYLGVISYVAAIIVELLGTADKVVKTIFLPEVVAKTENAINLSGLIALPFGYLLEHALHLRKCSQHVYVVRHHDEVRELILLTIKMTQALRDDL